MQQVVLMTVCQSCCSLKGQTTETVEVAINLNILQCTAFQVLHQFIVTVLSVNISTAVVLKINNHLKLERAYQLEQFLVDIEIRIVEFQHILPTLSPDKVHLSLT